MKKILAFVLAGAVLCVLGLAAADIVSKSGTARISTPHGKSLSDTQALTRQAASKDDPWGIERYMVDQTKIEFVTAEKHSIPSDSLSVLKKRIEALEAELQTATARHEDPRALRNQLDDLYSKLPQAMPAGKAAMPPAATTVKSLRPELSAGVSLLTAAVKPALREGAVSPQRTYASSDTKLLRPLPEGMSLSSSLPANEERAVHTPRKMSEPLPEAVIQLQRQAEEIQAAGGDVSTIKERINAVLGESSNGTPDASMLNTSPTAAGYTIEAAAPTAVNPNYEEIQSLLVQRKQTEISGGDATAIDHRLAELGANRGRETLDDNGGVMFYSSHAPVGIPHWSCAEGSITVADLGSQITDVEVQIDTLTYGYNLSLIDVYLISPAGDTCTLSTGNGGSGHYYYNTLFDDDAATSITAGTSPFSGTYRPEEALSVFDGENPNGVWKMRVCDNEDNGGNLRRWRLQIRAPLIHDTCGVNAPEMPVPGMRYGNTCLALADYNYACPYTDIGARDVVLQYTPPIDQNVTFSLCRSGYDTRLMVYDGACTGTPAWCNDDAAPCPGSLPGPQYAYHSLLECLPLQAAHTYYIIVDGYSDACGDYVLEAGICPPCTLTCLPSDTIECAENPDTSHYRLDCDGGCNNVNVGGVASYDSIHGGDTLCGLGFTYVRENQEYRDTDWYRFVISERSRIRVTVFAEFAFTLYIMNTACLPSISHTVYGNACESNELSVVCMDAGTYTLWIAPTSYNGIPVPLPYRIIFECEPCPDGVDCSDPVVLSTQYFTMPSQTTCWYGDQYNSTCLGSYDNGEDILYQWTVGQEGNYAVWLDPLGTDWTGFVLDDHCPPDVPGSCIAIMQNSGSLPYGLTSQHLTAGTYYIMVDTWPDPICIPEFDLAVGRVLSCVSCQPLDYIECAETLDSTNAQSDCDGGCNNAANGGISMFGFMATSDTVCGKAFTYVYRGTTFRDTDWYRFSINSYDTVRAHAVGEFPLQLNLLWIDSNCTITTLDYLMVAACDTAHVSAVCLEPGEYIAFVAPSIFTGIPYPQDYRLWIDLRPCPPGQDCHTPIDIVDGATVPAQTTQGLLNDYSNTCLGNYDGGPDIIFKWQITEDGDYKIKVNPYTTTRTGVLLDDNCPPDVSGCITYHASSPAAVHNIACRSLTAGTYYIMVDTYPPPNYIPRFDLFTGRCYTCVVPQAGDITECAETADTTNLYTDCDGGCNNLQTHLFSTIASGQTIAGRCFTGAYGDSWFRDTDWYRFDMASPESVHVDAVAEFPFDMNIFRLLDNCTVSSIVTTSAEACSTLAFTTACLDTGAYVLWIGPADFEGIPDPADYRVTFTSYSCLTPGTNCITAIPISGDTTLTGLTSCGTLNDYDTTCLGSWDDGEDLIVQWTITQAGSYMVSLYPHGTNWSAMALSTSCPSRESGCIALSEMQSNWPHAISCHYLTAGTYYLMVDTWPEPDCIPTFDLDFRSATTPINNNCWQGTTLTPPETVYGSTFCAPRDTLYDACADTLSMYGVWYDVHGTGNTITATLCSTAVAWDAKLAVFSCYCDNISCVTTGDDNCGYLPTVQWCSRDDEEYHILVYGWSIYRGDFRLDVQDNGVPCGYGARCPCWDDTLAAPGQVFGSTIGSHNSCTVRPSPERMVRVTIPSAGYWNFSLCGSNFDTYLYLGTDCCVHDIATEDDYFCGNIHTLQSEVCVYLPLAGYYYVTIEGFNLNSVGNFVLNVQPSNGAVPPQVTGVSATDDQCDVVVVTWNDVTDEDGYEIWVDISNWWVVPADCTMFVEDWSTHEVRHGYTVTAISACGRGTTSAPDSGMAWSEVEQVTGVSATDTSCANIFISWSDIALEDGFKIFRNGVQIGTTGRDTVSFMDTPGIGTFGYTIRGYNNACGDGILSAADTGIVLQMPTFPTDLTASTWYCDRVVLAWTDAQYETSYRIYRDGSPLSPYLPANTTTYTDCTAVPGVSHNYGVNANNFCGSRQTSASGTRLAIPPQVTNVAATDALCNWVHITWTDAGGETGYEVHRNGSIIANPLPANTVFYLDTTAVADVVYAYTVCAFNPGCIGPCAVPDSGRRRPAPQQAPVLIIPDSCMPYTACWPSVPYADSYIIRRDGITIDTIAAGTTCYSDSFVPQQHTITAAAFNECGEGPQSPPITIGFSILPTISSLSASDTLCDRVVLTWSYTQHADSFFIYSDGTLLGRSTLPTFTDCTAVPYTVYAYTVRGHNVCGIGPLSARENGSSWHVPAQVLNVIATQNRCDSVHVDWTDVAHETGYRIYRDGVLIFTTGANSFFISDAPSPGSYTYTVEAFNSCGSGTISAPATGIRLAAPGTPPSITASDDLCHEVILVWGDATGDVDEYRFYRDGVLIGSALPGLESFVDTAAVGRHAYTVAAFSTECGTGAQSAPDSGTGHGIPSAPGNLLFVSPAVCDSVQLTWQAAAGEVMMYMVRRDGVVLDSTTLTHYTDRTVNDANEYSYTVAAQNTFCGSGPMTSAVIGYIQPLMEITSGLLDTVPSGHWLVLDLQYCSGTDCTRFFLSLNNGPYQHLRTIMPSAHDSLYFEPVTANTPDCRLLAVTYRDLRADSITSPDFVLEAASSAIGNLSGIPADFFLGDNYPNPFNPSTTIRFGVPHTAVVRMEVFDMLGRRVAVVLNSSLPPGVHSVVWDCSSCPSGMYVLRMESEQRAFLKKMLLMK
jgi:subtilisin-like proprotein convertase family protein